MDKICKTCPEYWTDGCARVLTLAEQQARRRIAWTEATHLLLAVMAPAPSLVLQNLNDPATQSPEMRKAQQIMAFHDQAVDVCMEAHQITGSAESI